MTRIIFLSAWIIFLCYPDEKMFILFYPYENNTDFMLFSDYHDGVDNGFKLSGWLG